VVLKHKDSLYDPDATTWWKVEARRLLAGARPLGVVRAPRRERATMSDPRTRLIALLVRLAPDVAAEFWSSGARGLDDDERLNTYGAELESLVDTLGLESDDE
jgi:hypothetical protein